MDGDEGQEQVQVAGQLVGEVAAGAAGEPVTRKISDQEVKEKCLRGQYSTFFWEGECRVCILRRYHRHHPDEELEFSLCPVTKMFAVTNDSVSSGYCDFKGGPG